MPELPEVETIKTYLSNKIQGKTISDIEIKEPKQFIGDKQKIIGQSVIDIGRKGKVLTLKLTNNIFINIHLKMSGQILYAEDKHNAVYAHQIPKTYSNKMPGNTTRIIITFSDNSALFYNDLRKFGWIKIADKPLVPPSVDVLSNDFTFEYFQKAVQNLNKPIKPLLMEQNILAGIGNIYANDSVYVAQIDPRKKAKTLTEKELKTLYKAVNQIVREGIKYKGSSSKDEAYITPDGSRGSYQDHFKVYHREGSPCPRCHETIQRIKQNGRSTFFCPGCQK